jgi:hypothetical protein
MLRGLRDAIRGLSPARDARLRSLTGFADMA